MFSITTIASSTTKPVAIVSAISERLSRLKPNSYMMASAPTSDSGTDRLGMIVAGMLRRNRKITSTTRPTASDSSNSTSVTEARIVTVRSVSGVIWIAAGSEAVSCGSSFLMLSTTWMTLAPGWRWMLTIEAGVAVRSRRKAGCSRRRSRRVATSLSLTGALLR